MKDDDRTFDYSENGTAISFEEAWSQFKLDDTSKFYSMPTSMIMAMLLFIFLFHTIASALLHKLTRARREDGRIKPGLSFICIIQGMHSFLMPPLHLDWEELFILSKGKSSIRSCWKRYLLNIIPDSAYLTFYLPCSPS